MILGELDTDRAKSVAQAGIVVEKIRVALAEPYSFEYQAEGKAEIITVTHQCTCSIGVELFMNHEESQDGILKRADIAMYQAKEAGRNQVRFCQPKS